MKIFYVGFLMLGLAYEASATLCTKVGISSDPKAVEKEMKDCNNKENPNWVDAVFEKFCVSTNPSICSSLNRDVLCRVPGGVKGNSVLMAHKYQSGCSEHPDWKKEVKIKYCGKRNKNEVVSRMCSDIKHDNAG